MLGCLSYSWGGTIEAAAVAGRSVATRNPESGVLMIRTADKRLAGFLLLSLTAAACGSSIRKAAPTVAAPPAIVAPTVAAVQPVLPSPVAPPEDPVLTLIDTSDRYFKAGQ